MGKLAVRLVLNVDDPPAGLAAPDLSAVDKKSLFGAHNGKGEHALDLGVEVLVVLVVLFVAVGRVEAELVVGKLVLEDLLERLALGQSHGVGLGNDRDDVGSLGQLLEHNNVNGLETMARGLNEEENAVDTGVEQVPLPLCSELLAEVL